MWHTNFWKYFFECNRSNRVADCIKGTDIAINLIKDFLDKEKGKLSIEYITNKTSKITLTNKEIKQIVKVNKH